jgi:hypothetical protein
MKLSMFAKVSIGLVSTIVVAAAIYLLGIRPASADITEHERYIGELDQKIAQQLQAEALVREAAQRVKEAQTKLARIEVRKMPKSTIDLRNRLNAWVQYHDMIREIGKKLEAWPMKTGVQRLYNVTLPAPPTDPNALPEKLMVFPIGSVQVRASSFQALLRHVERWNDIPNLLVMVDGLAIQGTSPRLFGSYSMTVYVYPKTRDGQAGPPVPTAGGGTGGFGAPGMGAPGMGAPGIAPPGGGGFGSAGSGRF